jgi:hypothetical protein
MVGMEWKIKERLSYWQSLWIKSIRFQPVFPTGNNFDRNLILNEEIIPFINKLMSLSKFEKYFWFIRNSINSFDACKKFLLKDRNVCNYGKNCNMKNVIIFIDTDMNIKNCRTLWNRNKKQSCNEFFDLVCCWFQN